MSNIFYEIIDNVVIIYQDSEQLIYQPNNLNGKPWASLDEMKEWAEDYVEELRPIQLTMPDPIDISEES